MIMSDYEYGKKLNEEYELEYFLEAYKHFTGDELSIFERTESPDFICERSNGKKVGIELTRVMRAPETRFWDEVLFREAYMDPYDALEFAWTLATKKSELKEKNKWEYKNRSILVLQLIDTPLHFLNSYLGKSYSSDFASLRFCEIWLADYSAIEAFDNIELFGLHPKKWWGYHQRPNPYQKPYG